MHDPEPHEQHTEESTAPEIRLPRQRNGSPEPADPERWRHTSAIEVARWLNRRL